MQLSESKTLENLKTAFANESAAMVRYEIFAEKAKQNGDEEISQVFRTTARNEKAHAQIWLGLIYVYCRSFAFFQAKTECCRPFAENIPAVFCRQDSIREGYFRNVYDRSFCTATRFRRRR